MRILSGLFFHSCKQGEELKTTEKLKKEPIENQKGGDQRDTSSYTTPQTEFTTRKRKRKNNKVFFLPPHVASHKTHQHPQTRRKKEKLSIANLYYVFLPFSVLVGVKVALQVNATLFFLTVEEINFFPSGPTEKGAKSQI
jgi:hypothetical protein